MRYALPDPILINGRYYLRVHVPNDIVQKADGKIALVTRMSVETVEIVDAVKEAKRKAEV